MKTSFHVVLRCVGLMMVWCGCEKEGGAEKPKEAVAAVDSSASDTAKVSAYQGERVAYEGAWMNKGILEAFRETNSPSIAAGNGTISDIALAKDSATITWYSHWSRTCPIRFAAKNRIVVETEYDEGGTIEINDGEMTFQRNEDSIVHVFVRVSDSATLNSSHPIDRLILKPTLVGEYRGDSGKALSISMDRLEGFKECPMWNVSLDYFGDEVTFRTDFSVGSEFDVINCILEDQPYPERIGYHLQADSLLLFTIRDDYHIEDTVGRFARKPD